MKQSQLTYLVKYHAVSDIGLLRENNEDALLCLPEFNIFVVADGLGGHQAGEIASKEAVDFFKTHITFSLRKPPETIEVFQHHLLEGFYATNSEIFHLSHQHHLLKGMGTTFSALAFFEQTACIVHVGDSRIYRFREGALEQLTQDHLGLRPGDSRVSEKGVLTKALGTSEALIPQLAHYPCQVQDLFLLCSDGLSDKVKEVEIQGVLSNQTLRLEEKVRMLVFLAKSKGGQDNISVALIQMQEAKE